MPEPEQPYREVKVLPESVIVTHEGRPDFEWSSDVEVSARAEGTSVTVGHLVFWVTGAKGGCKLSVTYRGQPVFSGPYQDVDADTRVAEAHG